MTNALLALVSSWPVPHLVYQVFCDNCYIWVLFGLAKTILSVDGCLCSSGLPQMTPGEWMLAVYELSSAGEDQNVCYCYIYIWWVAFLNGKCSLSSSLFFLIFSCWSRGSGSACVFNTHIQHIGPLSCSLLFEKTSLPQKSYFVKVPFQGSSTLSPG